MLTIERKRTCISYVSSSVLSIGSTESWMIWGSQSSRVFIWMMSMLMRPFMIVPWMGLLKLSRTDNTEKALSRSSLARWLNGFWSTVLWIRCSNCWSSRYKRQATREPCVRLRSKNLSREKINLNGPRKD